MTLSTFDANPDGSINQTAFNNRWVNQGGNRENDTYSGNVDWVVKPSFFVNVTGGVVPDRTARRRRSSAATQIRHIFGNCEQRRGHDQRRLPDRADAVPAAERLQRQHLVERHGARHLHPPLHQRQRDDVQANAPASTCSRPACASSGSANDVLNGRAQPDVDAALGPEVHRPRTAQTFAGTYGYYIVNQTGTIGKVHSNNYSLWFQDTWDVSSRLTLNLGVRAENEYVPSYKDQTQFPDALDIKFGFKDKIAPRLGFAYDVKGDGKWKAYGSYGWYYDITKLELPRGSFGGDHWVNYYWTLDTPDFSSIQCGEGTTGCPGRYQSSIVDFRHSSNQVDPGLRGVLQSSGHDRHRSGPEAGQDRGVHRRARARADPTMSLGVRYVHKWLFRTIEDVGIFFQGSEIYLISNPGEGLAVEHGAERAGR